MTTHQSYPDTHHDVSSNTIFGFWVYLMTDCVMFAMFFACYAVLHNNTFGGPGAKELFDLRYALVESIVLLISSFSFGIGMLFAPSGQKGKVIGWLLIAFVLGAIFTAMGFSEFSRLIASGNTWEKSAFLSSYFTLIGVHTLHILVGLMMMIVFVIQLLQRGFNGVVLRRLTCLRIYWHFLYLIWIFTFTIVYLIGVK